MLSLTELNNLFERLGTPPAGRRLVERTRKEAPVRDVQSRLGNVITLFASWKMGRTIATESRTIEFPAIIQYEHNPDVLEFYAQPARLDFILTDGGTKKPYRVQHIPDFLIIQNNQLLIEEWREEGRLLKLTEKHPGRFVREGDGWHFPEAEEQLAEMGVTYRIRSADEHPRQYVQNLIFLADYLSPDCPPVDEKALAALRTQFKDRAAVSLADLIEMGKRQSNSTAGH